MMNTEDWTIKYEPKSLNDIVSHKNAIHNLIEWSNNIKNKNVKNIVLLYGKHGIGKTIIANLLAKKNNWDILKIENINDIKNKYFLLLNNSQQTTFHSEKNIFNSKINLITNKNRLLLINVFEIVNKNIEKIILDYGNINKNSPIIIITNDFSYLSSSFINNCFLIKLNKIQQKSIEKHLLNIIKSENLQVKKEIIEEISLYSDGNIKLAIQNLQYYLLNSFNYEITIKEQETLKKKDFSFFISKIKNIKKKSEIINLKKKLINEKYIFIWIYNNIRLKNENLNKLLDYLNTIILSEKCYTESNLPENYWFDLLLLILINTNYHFINLKKKDILNKNNEFKKLLLSLNLKCSSSKIKDIDDYFIK